MRIVAPNALLREAAAILEPVRNQVIVVGAVAVQVALGGEEVLLTPTGDVDAGIRIEDADTVVDHLESQGMRPSEEPHEREFTWVRGDFKVQLMAPFNPIARRRRPAKGIPVNNLIGELEEFRWPVAFEEESTRPRFDAVRPAGLVALKEHAFGRARPNGELVDRDFSDVALLFDRLADRIVAELPMPSQMRRRVLRAATTLTEDTGAVAAAARELVRSGEEENVPTAEAMVRRAARDVARELG